MMQTGAALAATALLLIGNIAYAANAASVEAQFSAKLNAIASSLGFSTETSISVGQYTYNTSHTGLNAVYTDPNGNTLTIEYCVNGAYVATEQMVCSSAPNACGMVGTGFITKVISNERQVSSSQTACTARTVSNSLCSASGGAGSGSGSGTTTSVTTTNKCISAHLCNAANTAVIDSCTNSVLDDCGSRGYICSNGACLAQSISFYSFPAQTGAGQSFTATGHLQVSPALVQKGSIVQVYWNVLHASGCTVTGSNGDGLDTSTTGAWSTPFSGASGKVSSPITGQTIYHLVCAGLPGAVPASIDESVTVSILPDYQEQ